MDTPDPDPDPESQFHLLPSNMDLTDPSGAGGEGGAVDYRGHPADKSITGGWKSSSYIIGVEVAERFAYWGAASNLITYLTGQLGVPTAAAAAQVNAWSGVGSMLPLLCGLLADSCLGRFHGIVLASVLYFLGLGLLTLSATFPTLHPQNCNNQMTARNCHSTHFQLAFFFIAIYLVALAQSFHLPCSLAFAADQFDEKDGRESKSKSSFFNWWYFAMCVGTSAAILVVNYIQENIGWGLGFGIPGIAIAFSFIIFLLGRKTYRYHTVKARIPFPLKRSTRASLGSSSSERDNWRRAGNKLQVKELLKLFPIWGTSLMYSVVYAQTTTLFTKQGSTMDRRIGPNFQVPPAALLIFISFTIAVSIVIYDRAFVPLARKLTGIQSGITMLQRIGTGLFLAVVSMTIAAFVEAKRLKTARDSGLVDVKDATLPMSLWWLVPQYTTWGIADTFAVIGWQEFFYDQVPDGMRSLGLALYLSILGIGSFISSFLITMINLVTNKTGESWFADNLNRAHIDYFYGLLAVLNFLAFLLYLYFARRYRYKDKEAQTM